MTIDLGSIGILCVACVPVYSRLVGGFAGSRFATLSCFLAALFVAHQLSVVACVVIVAVMKFFACSV
jgi:hypothetical protein